MNDRFKFRVWFENQKKYTDKMYLRQDGMVAWNGTSLPAMIGEYIIEQCTGLKDKNGKLIYEGDIVTDGYVKRTVMWDGWYWNARAEANCPLDNTTCSIVEIIGNIHEQAEQKDK